jgi:hypothetical protein
VERQRFMVNFTVSLPEELKAEMDKFPDVNWSELTRKSIQNYLRNKSHVFSPLEFELTRVRFAFSHELLQPIMVVYLKVKKNSLDTQLIIDRMLFTVKFVKEHFVPHGEDDSVVRARENEALKGAFKEGVLDYTYIIKSEDDLKIPLPLPIAVLRRVNDKMQATFWVDITITAYVQGFEHSPSKSLSIKVPIDEWKTQVNSVLSNYDANWNRGQPTQKH